MKYRTIIDCVAIGLGMLFIYAAAGKLLDFQSFRLQAAKSPFFAGFASPLAFMAPLAELLVAALLLRPARRLTGLAGTLALISLYTIYLVSMLGTSDHRHCHCGEVWPGLLLEVHILLNLLIVLTTGCTIILSGRIRRRSPGLV